MFQETGAPAANQGGAPPALPGADGDAAAVQVLNRELLDTRERMRNLAEALEAANEELQSLN